MPIIWTKPFIQGASTFATVDGAIVGSVGPTAFPDGRWIAQVLPNGPDYRGHVAYTGSEDRCKEFVERWLAHHMPNTSKWKRPGRMPHERSDGDE